MLTENPKLFWSHLKSLRGAIKSSTPNVISPQQWVEHFSKLLYSENERKELFLNNDADRNTRNAILGSPFASEKIVKGTTLLKSKKSSGHDSISNEMIKASLPSSSSFLVTLFNKILQIQIYPEEWSSEITTSISKSGELKNPDNCRGITINSCLSKLFNLLLNNRLLCLINEKNILKNNQIGFRKGFRTADDVLTIKTLMDKYLSENKKLYFCFVDFRKAYDNIWRKALFEKFLGYGVSTNFVSLLKNIYERTKLSPILFNLFIDDINEIFDERFCH